VCTPGIKEGGHTRLRVWGSRIGRLEKKQKAKHYVWLILKIFFYIVGKMIHSDFSGAGIDLLIPVSDWWGFFIPVPD
jgi:hypothetical protein